ncbi:endonuclease MutS2 [Synechococcales cyanobacterium C]|uniref:Endonuclease MutS2 n=1 Tax=Petrachloros mirabilis ULC683 TaxID=2781853 RepID=A0A8K2A8A4_9CYAN|nr:endonuclease MutS2 [Petrachloros mirabilis]NCJ07791.1 endonuclease MutS2 [Petrachloros mirabilis ULC683]
MPQKTFDLLEWPRLCEHLSTFAATKLGTRAALSLQMPCDGRRPPFGHRTHSEHLLQQTQEVHDLETRLLTELRFDGIEDIGTALERATHQGILWGEELLHIATTLAGARTLRRTLDKHPTLEQLNQLVANLRTYPELEQHIRHCIDERGDVADRASTQLADIRQQQRQVRTQIQQTLQSLMQRKATAIQESLITQRGDRFVIPVKAPQKDAIPGIVHDTSTSGATLYVEPQITVELNNRLRQLGRQEDTEMEAIRRRLTEQVAEGVPDLRHIVDVVTTLDLATARARYSNWLGGNRPRFIDRYENEPITLRQLRHPLLMWQQNHEQGTPVVPIDVVIQPQTRVVAMTGPNTGGKTVTLKTLGLAALMAKVGLFVPAQEPVELPWFDQILADIGDEQSLQQSLSTFSGHIKRIQTIVEGLTEQSLVLLDEVGAGTDPAEGSALAIALLQYLADHAQLTVATTHFGELKALKYQDNRFENASVEFDDQTLAPTYRLLWGIPGRSNALIIAERLGLSPDIIVAAQTQLHRGVDDVNQVIAGLEGQRRQQEAKHQQAAQLLASTEKLYREVSAKAQALQLREQDLRQQQVQAIQAEIQGAKQEVAQVIRQLQQGPQNAQAAQKATEELEAIVQQRLPAPATPPSLSPGFLPQIGARVRVPSIGQTAEVISAPDESKALTVRFGLMKMTVNLSEIESLTGEKAEPTPKAKVEPKPESQPQTVPTLRTSQNTLDLRGYRVPDAEMALGDAIANAQGVLWIIHGHGTGKLRRGVQEYLSNHPQVTRFEFAEQSEGGRGVTIAHCQT